MGCGISKKARSSIDFIVPPIFQGKNSHTSRIKIRRSGRCEIRLITIHEVHEELEHSTSYT